MQPYLQDTRCPMGFRQFFPAVSFYHGLLKHQCQSKAIKGLAKAWRHQWHDDQARKSHGFCFDTLKDKMKDSYFFVSIFLFVLVIISIPPHASQLSLRSNDAILFSKNILLWANALPHKTEPVREISNNVAF